jgi:transcriptional regulator with XRE-family HTH domain
MMNTTSQTVEDFLANQIKEVRSRRDWTQDELARRARELGLADWTRSVVAAIEHRNRRLSIGELVAVAALLGTSLPDLLRAAPDELLIASSVAISKEALVGVLAGANPAAFLATGFRDLRTESEPPDWEGIRDQAFGSSGELPDAWGKLADLLQEQSVPGARAGRHDSGDVVRRSIEEDSSGEFERYIATRLRTSPEAVALAARLLYGISATDERDRRARPNMPKHRESREIVQEIEKALIEGPASDTEKTGGVWLTRVTGAAVQHRSAVPSRRYRPLQEHLERLEEVSIQLEFDEVEQILERDLPNSARRHRAWWANDPSHSHARSWLEAGWQVETADMQAGWVRFVRKERQR